METYQQKQISQAPRTSALIYILLLGLCCNMAVPSKSLWLLYVFCQLYLKAIQRDKFLFKEMFLLKIGPV